MFGVSALTPLVWCEEGRPADLKPVLFMAMNIFVSVCFIVLVMTSTIHVENRPQTNM